VERVEICWSVLRKHWLDLVVLFIYLFIIWFKHVEPFSVTVKNSSVGNHLSLQEGITSHSTSSSSGGSSSSSSRLKCCSCS